MSVGDVMQREERPPYVQFERRPVENKSASIEAGRYVATDVDFVLVTPPYSKDCIVHKVSSWFEITRKNVQNGRTPAKWLEAWEEAYRRWKDGQEIPLDGTPIKGWGIISPAQQEMLVHLNIRTVEDLAGANDEGLRRIGIGAMDLKQKAAAWLASMKDHGAVTQEVSSLKQENSVLRASLETLQKQLSEIKAMIPQKREEYITESAHGEITADDLLLDEQPVKKQRGRPPKVQDIDI